MRPLQALVLAVLAATPSAGRADVPPPVLLVHGMAWDLQHEDGTWGSPTATAGGETRWGGMIGFLQSQGFRYGGTIRATAGRVQLPESFEFIAPGDPRSARVFVLKFSSSANADGLALKALELAETIRQLCRYTGAEKVRLVAHSAGGLVARVYLQSALPGVEYRGDVDRLVTIATPHLGSDVAEHFGDFLGTRATSIRPSAALIAALNNELELPSDTLFASIVVRGLAADVRGDGSELDKLINGEVLDKLPVEYRCGGDQVVHVRSQNLRLAACAVRYEQRTGRPVQYMLARVPDPSPRDFCWRDPTVHVAAPADDRVQRLVSALVHDGALLWATGQSRQLSGWRAWQAALHANGAVEAETLRKHPWSEVTSVRIRDFTCEAQDEHAVRYTFAGRAQSQNMLLALRNRWTEVAGSIDITFDEFGRVLAAQPQMR